jgi:hypothetical protein
MRLQRLLVAGESLPDAGKIYLLTAVPSEIEYSLTVAA